MSFTITELNFCDVVKIGFRCKKTQEKGQQRMTEDELFVSYINAFDLRILKAKNDRYFSVFFM